jgi:hypothetical protein
VAVYKVLVGSYSEKCIASELSRDQISVLLFSVFQSTVLPSELFKFKSMWSVLGVGHDARRVISGNGKPPEKLVLTLTITPPPHTHTHTHNLHLGGGLKFLKYLSTSFLLIFNIIMSFLIMLRHLSFSCLILSELCIADNLYLLNSTQWLQDVLGKASISLSQ